MKRARVRPISVKRKAENERRREAMLLAFGPREEWGCDMRRRILSGDLALAQAFGTCFGAINGHELLKRSQGGSITDMTNIVLLCDRHNVEVENKPKEAERFGYVIHAWERNEKL